MKLSHFQRLFFYLCLTAGFLILPFGVFAESTGVFKLVGLPADDVSLLIIRLFQILWLLASIVFLVLLIVGFLKQRNAGDDLAEGAQGKKLLLIGGIGLGASLLISVILFFIYASLEKNYLQMQNGAVKKTDQNILEPSFGRPLNQYLKIVSHFPARDERNIARNIKIMITFAEPMNETSIMDDKKSLKKNSVRILAKGASFQAALDAHAELSADHKILSITPDKLLGDLNAKIFYSVTVTDLVKKETGESLLGNGSGYSWQFEVSGVVDTTPPQVESVVPFASSKEPWSTNTLIQITFNEAIDPSALNGKKLFVMNETTKKTVEGTWSFGNAYRTLSFLSQEPCGKNACQETLFCLPKDSILRVTVLASNLVQPKKAESPNKGKFPYDGIVDVAGNSLDGGGESGVQKNGKSEGPSQDNYTWSFKTSGILDTTAPVVEFVQPARDKTGVDLTAPLEVLFSKLMDLTSLQNGTIVLSNDISTWMTAINYEKVKKTSVKVNHDPLKKDTLYTPLIKAEVHDVFQNCFYPCNGPMK